MDKATYHHGDLKQELIHNGLLLLDKEGIAGFSLRKVASMCGVSHNAPYKHFKDKDELIRDIISEIWHQFYLALRKGVELYPEEPALQIVEMGKQYVKFLVENPEYLKLMFLSDSTFPVRLEIKINEATISSNKNSPAFKVFRDTAENYFKEIQLDQGLYMQKTLTMWSLVHGLALLIPNSVIEYDKGYLDLVERLIRMNIVK